MLRVVLCDYSNEYIAWFKNEIMSLVKSHGYDMEIAQTVNKPDDLDNFIECKNGIVLYILDTDYPDGSSGIEFARKIRQIDRESYIVFITENNNSINSVFGGLIRPAGFFIKPILREDFNILIADIYRDYLNSSGIETSVLNINIGAQMYRVEHSQIFYLESLQKKVYVHTLNQRIGYYDSLSSLEKKLGDGFMRCHKSYVVNMDKISMIDYSKNKVILQTGDEIDISRSYKNYVKSRMANMTANIK